MRKEHFPRGKFAKLSARAMRRLNVLQRIGNNAYKIDLLAYYEISNTFNIANLLLYYGDLEESSSRTSLSQPRENDAKLTSMNLGEVGPRLD